MSLMSRKVKMKNTLKIEYQQRMNGGVPVIKIVQSVSTLNPDPSEDIDPKDTLLNVFLHDPMNSNPTKLFGVSSFYPHPFDNPTHHITNIEPIRNEGFFSRLRGLILNTLDEWHVEFDKGKINSLFDEIDKKLL